MAVREGSLADRWLVLVDFDGTLTQRDGDFLVADALLGPERKGAWQPLAEAYERLNLSTAGYFAAWLALLHLDSPTKSIARVGATLALRARAATAWSNMRAAAKYARRWTPNPASVA